MVYNNSYRYKETDHMCDVICDEPSLLQMISRFGIPLGVGDQTVRQVCEAHGVDTLTFLSVANFIRRGARGAADSIDSVSVACLTSYLKQAHSYFLDFQLPAIRRKLLEALDCSQPGEVSYLILKFYDDYMSEVRKHMQHENRKVFGYVEQLLQGRRTGDYSISQFARGHNSIDVKLQELKNIIIKYLPSDGLHNNQLSATLYDIYNNEEWLNQHSQVEEEIFIPAVRNEERKLKQSDVSVKISNMINQTPQSDEQLSDREKDVIVALVQGMTNKEIADHLFISINTVITHRRNIARKLQIHSPAGLTIYAIVNNLVDISSVKL